MAQEDIFHIDNHFGIWTYLVNVDYIYLQVQDYVSCISTVC
jgi:hypothetical protein